MEALFDKDLILPAIISMIFGYFGACLKKWHEDNVKAKYYLLDKLYIPYIQMFNSFDIANNHSYESLSEEKKQNLFKLLSENVVYTTGKLQEKIDNFIFYYNNPSYQKNFVMHNLYMEITHIIFLKYQKSIVRYQPFLNRIPTRFKYYKRALRFRLNDLLGKGR